ncbi:FAD-dependent oxidoreductase [Jatrophihabitans sp.]|uniref:FAD-dependent oxidoreductase n=1 Tax=Jatrophihabitans sp. TaxID=1932789 RepID=UPI0030C6BE60|nr:FAD-binding protein [Jatrophihabitans sp.]
MSAGNTIATDVLVLGAGPSGLTAAHQAALSGASVLLVDRTGELGGNGAFSSGYMAFAGTSLQREQGIDDTPERFLQDMVTEVERKRQSYDPEFGLEVGRRFAEESGPTFEYLRELGFGFGRFVPRPIQHTAARMVVMLRTAQFQEIYSEILPGLGVTFMPHARARELVSTNGAVTGALVERADQTITEIHASRAVIVTTGGYQASAELRARYQPKHDPLAPYQGLETIVGDGQLMLEAAGAELVNMHMVPELVKMASRLVEECIALNEEGLRFEDEAGPYSERLRLLRAQPGGIGYFLCDADTARRHAQLLAEIPGTHRRVNTIADVARTINAPLDVVARTVERWNATVESGATADPDFGRVIFPDPRIGIRTPPFTVVPMIVGTDISAGGVRVSADMEALDKDGNAIPNLYAAGDSSGMINSAAGLGGVHLASAVTLGRVAGRSAVS